jgi:hypothetical protein
VEASHVFTRSKRGTEEVASGASSLSPKHRRCLILVDGKKTLRELAACFRPGELGTLLRELVERGLLDAPTGDSLDAIEKAAGAIGLIDEARFLDIQSRAMKEITERAGPAGSAVVMQIRACARAEQLRIALRSVERILVAVIGPEDARDFVRRIGQELMGG